MARDTTAGLSAPQREFIKQLTGITRRETPSKLFEAFVEMAYCSFAQAWPKAMTGKLDDTIEARYMRHATRLGKNGCDTMAALCGLMVQTMEETEGCDFLGEIAQAVGSLHAGVCQFFTPWAVSEMMARMTLHGIESLLDEQPYITIAEPAVGAGVMVLAVAKVLREMNVNVSTRVWFEAVDVMALAQQMAFVQMTMAGCSGRVICGNTLTRDRYDVATLPCSVAFVARNGPPRFDRPEHRESIENAVELTAAPPPPLIRLKLPPRSKRAPLPQLSLFEGTV